MKKSLVLTALWMISTMLFIAGCGDKEDCCDEGPVGSLTLRFSHYNDRMPLITDSMMYVNAAGNPYLVNEIQYFISDVTLHSDEGGTLLLGEWKDIHYVDTDLPSTHEWNIYDPIPTGDYTQLRFTFGINEEKNQSMLYVNPPESLMFWPEYLGGGYHYMKLNGKWKDTTGMNRPFNFHLGIGQEYDQEGNITGFIQNYFTVDIELRSMTIREDEETVVEIIMNVDKWFTEPSDYNHDDWGGDIMQKQQAMRLGIENGWNVFSEGTGNVK